MSDAVVAEDARSPEAVSFGALTAGRVVARALSTTFDGDRVELSRSFCSRMIEAWWDALAERADCRLPVRTPFPQIKNVTLADTAGFLARQLGCAAADLDVEVAAYEIGLFYTGMLPKEHRSAFGIYYTPPALAKRLTQTATRAGVDWRTWRALDPACGGGAFLTPMARAMIDALPECEPAILAENVAGRLTGFEVDPFAAWLAQVSLEAALLPLMARSRRRPGVSIQVRDSLEASPPAKAFDLVIGNPPYGRVKLGPDARQRFARSLYGHANLYGLFTQVALEHVRKDGVVAYVTPTSFLSGEYYKRLRSLLRGEAPPFSIDFVSDRKGVFDDVLQETLLAVYKKRQAASDPNAGPSVRFGAAEISPSRDGSLRVRELGTFDLPADTSSPWIMPRRKTEVPIVESLSRMRHRLVDWGYAVSTGPLVWNRHKDQLRETDEVGAKPIIWAEAVTSDGFFRWRCEKRNHKPFILLRDKDGWLATTRPCIVLQRTTAKEQSRRLIAAAIPQEFIERYGIVVIENHLNMVRPIAGDPAVPPDVVAAFLNSTAADAAFRCINGSVAVSAYELEALPLPDPRTTAKTIDKLLRRGASRQAIDDACARLYEQRALR